MGKEARIPGAFASRFGPKLLKLMCESRYDVHFVCTLLSAFLELCFQICFDPIEVCCSLLLCFQLEGSYFIGFYDILPLFFDLLLPLPFEDCLVPNILLKAHLSHCTEEVFINALIMLAGLDSLFQ